MRRSSGISSQRRIAGSDRAERRTLGQFDVGARGTVPVADPDRTVDDEDDVRAEVTVASHDHSRVVARVEDPPARARERDAFDPVRKQ